MKSLSHQFLDFCRSKPVDEEYSYWSWNNCAIQQFVADRGFPHSVYMKLDDIGQVAGDTASRIPYTFGALADRLAERLGVK